jgi:hypothetical protein
MVSSNSSPGSRFLRSPFAASLLLVSTSANALSVVGLSPPHPQAGQPVSFLVALEPDDHFINCQVSVEGSAIHATILLDDVYHPPEPPRTVGFPLRPLGSGIYTLEVSFGADYFITIYTTTFEVAASPIPASGPLGLCALTLLILVSAIRTIRRRAGSKDPYFHRSALKPIGPTRSGAQQNFTWRWRRRS